MADGVGRHHSGSRFALTQRQAPCGDKPLRPWILLDEPARPLVRALPRTTKEQEPGTGRPHASHKGVPRHPRSCWINTDGTILTAFFRNAESRFVSDRTFMCKDPEMRLAYELRREIRELHK